jgi:hypothetical protein
MINGTSPMGLGKVVKELHESERVKVLEYRGPLPFAYDELRPHLFKEGLPDEVCMNLTDEERRQWSLWEPEQIHPGLWDRFKRFLLPPKESRLCLKS